MLDGVGPCGRSDPNDRKANRLDPRGAYAWSRYQHIGWAMLMLGRDEEAISWTQRALAANPNVRPDWRHPLNNMDAQGVLAWIDNYCAAHPIETVKDATKAFYHVHPR